MRDLFPVNQGTAKVTFSQRVKSELVRRKGECRECPAAELAGFVHTAGSIAISGRRRVSVAVEVDQPAAARRVFSLAKQLLGVHSQIVVRKSPRFKKASTYIVVMPSSPEAIDVLRRLRVIAADGTLTSGIPWGLVGNRCCQRAYLRGAFTGRGYVSDPVRSYHLELSTASEDHASDLVKLVSEWDIQARVVEHKKRYVLYVKDADHVSTFLQVIGADRALLEFENVRAMKSVRNIVNRSVNCETANVEKTVEAAAKQIEDIRTISETIGLGALKTSLRQVAELRLEMPSATMKEIGEALTPAVSKSTVSYRFRRIAEIADELRQSSASQIQAKQEGSQSRLKPGTPVPQNSG